MAIRPNQISESGSTAHRFIACSPRSCYMKIAYRNLGAKSQSKGARRNTADGPLLICFFHQFRFDLSGSRLRGLVGRPALAAIRYREVIVPDFASPTDENSIEGAA
jgi:hypothetical protein